MNKPAVAVFAVVLVGLSGAANTALADGDVNIYSYRQPELLQPVLDAFTKKTGIAANVLYLDKGLIERMQIEGENSPADVIIASDIVRLNDLKVAGVIAALKDAAIDAAIPAKFRDLDGQWFGLGADVRAIYASKARVKQAALGYDDLTKPEWKGRICIRDGQYASNLGLFADRIAALGPDQAETWLIGLKANLAGRPSGSDSDQIQAIFDGKCDLAIGNATIIAAALNSDEAPDEKKLAEAVRVLYPDAAGHGGYANISGMALARFAPNRDNAIKLMRYLTSREAQELYVGQTLEYPVVPGAQPADVVKPFGTFKPDAVPLGDVVGYRDKASELVDKVGFNDGPGQ